MHNRKHTADIFFIILLAGIFAASAVMLAILGVRTYSRASDDVFGQNTDTAALFFAQKIRRCEDKSSISTKRLESTTALVLQTNSVSTYLFVHDGYLKELTSAGGSDVSEDFGQQLIPMKSACFDVTNGNLLTVTLTGKDNSVSDIKLYLSGKGESGE